MARRKTIAATRAIRDGVRNDGSSFSKAKANKIARAMGIPAASIFERI